MFVVVVFVVVIVIVIVVYSIYYNYYNKYYSDITANKIVIKTGRHTINTESKESET